MQAADSPNSETNEMGTTVNDPNVLYATPDEDVEAAFIHELARRRKIVLFARAFGIFFAAVAVFAIATWIVDYFTGADHGWWKWINWLNFINLASWGVASLLTKNAGKFIESANDKRAIGPLIDMLGIRDNRFGYDNNTRELAVAALIRLLPEVCESDDVILTTERRKVLGSLILRETDGTFVFAAIEALAKTGRAEVIRSLEEVKSGKGLYTGKNAQDIAQKALACIQNRIELEQAHATLLRPSESVSNADPNLLRPAEGAVSTDSALLLHASNDCA